MEINNIISSGILELYSMGMTSAEESMQVEQWIKQYPEVVAELESIQAAMEDYAQLHSVAPAPGSREKILSRINKGNVVEMNIPERTSAKIIGISPAWKYAAAACIVLLIGSMLLNYNYYNKYRDANSDLQTAQTALDQQKELARLMEQDMNVVRNPQSMPVALKGMESMPDATAKIFWMQNTGDVMVDASNLPDAPAGKQYQLWAIVDGKPVDGGMIITNDKGVKFRMQKMKSFGKAQAFAISLEKEGGNPTPTQVVSMGEI